MCVARDPSPYCVSQATRVETRMLGGGGPTSPRLLPLRRPDHRRFLPLLRLMFIEHQPCRAGPLLRELLAMVGAPVERIDPRPVVAGEMRHHVALIQFV